MKESEFNRYMSRSLVQPGGDYATGYRLGLRRHYHGEQFQLPASIEVLSDIDCLGNEAHGFIDGLAGRSPTDPAAADVTSLHMEPITRAEKSAWITASRDAGMKLVPWARQALNRAAAKDD